MVSRQPPAVVGRDRELAQLRDALDDAIQGRSRMVLIGGEAGIGKTALVGSLAADARSSGVGVFTGQCNEFDMVPPYGPWLNSGLLGDQELPDGVNSARTPERQSILNYLQRHESAQPAEIALELNISPNAAAQMLRRMFADGLIERPRYGHYAAGAPRLDGSHSSHSSRQGLADGVPAEKPPAAADDGPAWPAIIVDRLRGLTSSDAVVVVLEDMHWSDEASLALVSSVIQQLDQERLLVVTTYRDDEMLASRPLQQYLPGLLRRAQAGNLQLRRLEALDIHNLVALRYGLPAQDAARAAQYLHRYAEGNPFFTEELLRNLEFDDVLRHTVFGWSLAELPQFQVPPALRQLITAQLGLLYDTDRGLLQIAAVIGVEIPYELWLAISDIPDEELADVIERAMQLRLIVETADRVGLRFRHALVRETLYDTVVLPRRRAWHRRIGETLAKDPHADPESIAHHFNQARDNRVTDWLIRAGRRAARASAYTTACALLESALAGLKRDDERAWLLCEMAEYYRYIDYARGLAHLDSAQVIADQVGDAALRVVVMACRARVLGAAHGTQHLDEFRQALALFDTLAVADRERVLQSRLGYLLRGGTFGQWFAHYGYFAEALPILEQAIANDNPSGTQAEIYESASAYFGLGIARSALGEPERAQRAYAMARALFRSLGIAHLVRVTLSWELETILVDYFADRPAERQALLREYAESQQGADYQAATATGATLLDGNWDVVRSGIEAQRRVDALRIYHARLLAELDRLQGNYAQAWSHIAGAVPDGPDTQPTTYQFHNTLHLLQTGAALALDEGDMKNSRRWIQAFEHYLDWSGTVSKQAAPHLLWSRYYQLAGDLEAARWHAQEAHSHASAPRQALALLAAGRAMGELDTLDGRFADAGQHLHAALELAEACAVPHEIALSLLASARLDLALHNRDAALSALERAEALCLPLDARPTLEKIAACRVELTPEPAESLLSAREIQVLRLVSKGLTDRDVAAELYVSPRTINQHLRSIYNKLGVNSRTAATRLALERGII